jgi:hypothetical protein
MLSSGCSISEIRMRTLAPKNIAAFFQYLRRGGLVVLEDMDFGGHFTYPDFESFQRYCELYCKVVRRGGGDPNIGPRLPILLMDCGFKNIEMSVVQPAGTRGEVKLLNPITLENITDTVLEDGLASRQEIDALIKELYRFAHDPRTVSFRLGAAGHRLVRTNVS